VTLTLDPEHIAAYAAALAGLVYLARLVRKAVIKLDAIDKLTSRELERNHGSSMKDDVHGMAIALGILQREHGKLRADFDTHINERKTP